MEEATSLCFPSPATLLNNNRMMSSRQIVDDALIRSPPSFKLSSPDVAYQYHRAKMKQKLANNAGPVNTRGSPPLPLSEREKLILERRKVKESTEAGVSDEYLKFIEKSSSTYNNKITRYNLKSFTFDDFTSR